MRGVGRALEGRWEGVGRALGGRWEGVGRALGGHWEGVGLASGEGWPGSLIYRQIYRQIKSLHCSGYLLVLIYTQLSMVRKQKESEFCSHFAVFGVILDI